MADYYTYHTLAVDLRGERLAVVAKPGLPGWDGLDPGTVLLAEAIEVEPEDMVLDLGCGPGAVGVVAARLAQRGQVVLADTNIVAVEATRRTLAANEVNNASVVLSDGTAGLSPEMRFNVVALHLPRGKAVIEQFIRQAASVLVPGGRLYLAGSKHSGLKGAVAVMRQVFGAAGTIGMKKGHHVVVAQRRANEADQPLPDGYHTFEVELLGHRLRACAKPGVFAWEGLDDGTRALIEVLSQAKNLGSAETVLDLGCGSGLVGLCAALRAPAGQVYLVDADVRAAESSRRTLAANGVTNATVLISDCAAVVADVPFDVVAANPPFHQGVGTDYEVALQFVRDAARVLKPRGRLYLVANRFLNYEPHLQAAFGNVQLVWQDNRYKVLLSRVSHRDTKARRAKRLNYSYAKT